jgi:phenylpropionate dioxygenase-like ring-hydroxylating dioxygenase large terminal subunit
MTLRFPKTQYPVGWFQVGRSHEFEPGAVKAAQNFGENIVIWRSESGEISVQDAYCLHQGAHRGIKGWVAGESLVCPFHGWQWGTNGANTFIPESEAQPSLCVRTYPVQEWCGNIMVWWSPDQSQPTWELPKIPEYEDPRFHPMHPYSDKTWRIRAHPQMCGENSVDFSHTHFIHGTTTTPKLVEVKIDGPVIRADVSVLYGGDRERTSLTPDGPAWGLIQQYQYGCGLAVVRWPGAPVPSLMIVGFTPVDDDYIDYHFQVTSQREDGVVDDEPAGRARSFMRVQTLVQEQDFFTWENMKIQDPPHFTPKERPGFEMYREWARQFYPHDSTMQDA